MAKNITAYEYRRPDGTVIIYRESGDLIDEWREEIDANDSHEGEITFTVKVVKMTEAEFDALYPMDD